MRYLQKQLRTRLERSLPPESGITLIEEAAVIFLSVPILLMAVATMLYGLMIMHYTVDTANRQSAVDGAIPSIINNLNATQSLGACSDITTIGPANLDQQQLITALEGASPTAPPTASTPSWVNDNTEPVQINNVINTAPVGTSATSPPSAPSGYAENLGYYMPMSLTYAQCAHPIPASPSLYSISSTSVCFYAYPGGSIASGAAPSLECMWEQPSTDDLLLTIFQPQTPSYPSTELYSIASSNLPSGSTTKPSGSPSGSNPTYTNCDPNNCWTPAGVSNLVVPPGQGMTSLPSGCGTTAPSCSESYIGRVSSTTPGLLSYTNAADQPVVCTGSGNSILCGISTTSGGITTTNYNFPFTSPQGEPGYCSETTAPATTTSDITCEMASPTGYIVIPNYMAALYTVTDVTLDFTAQIPPSFVPIQSANSVVAHTQTATIRYTVPVGQAQSAN